MAGLSRTERRRRWLWGLAATLLVGLVGEVALIGSFGASTAPLVLLPHATYGLVLTGLIALVLLFVLYASQSLRALAAEESESQRLAMREAVIRDRLAAVSDLFSTTGQLAQKPDLRGTLNLALNRALPCFEADHASVLMAIPGTGQLEVLLSVGDDTGSDGMAMVRSGEGLIGGVHATGEALTVNTPEVCARLGEELKLASSPCAGMCVPVSYDGNPMGVFCVARMTFDEPFTPMHIRSLQVLAAHCGAAIFRSLHERRIQTERVEAQAALLDNEKRYRRFFEHNIAGAYISTPEGRLLDCNIAFARMLGRQSVAETLAADAASLHPDPAARAALLAELRAQHHVDRREVCLRRADGDLVHAIETAVGVCGARGELLEIHGYVIDDTERRKAREQLRLSQRMEAIGRLTGGIAHNFNNMLTAVIGSAEMIQARTPVDHPAHAKAEGIKKASMRAATLTRQLLAYSRQQTLQPKVLDLGAVVTDMEDVLRQALGGNIEFVTTRREGTGRVKVDPGQMQQILLNLALNARDAMPNGGRFTIVVSRADIEGSGPGDAARVARPGSYVLMQTTDTGCGMDAETQARAFEPFFTTKPAGQGAGLGLSTVYGIVKQSGGYVYIDSTPDRGTTFRIYLPRVEAELEREEKPAYVPGRGGETILLAEDEDLVRTVIRETLTSGGYQVLAAKSAGEAVVLSNGHDGPIDLLVTDLVMPGKNGHELVARLAESRPDMVVLCISGYADPTTTANGGTGAEYPFLQKPFTSEVLLHKVRETLDQPRARAA